MILPNDKQDILDNATNDLKNIANVRAIVLGGSYATGTATDTSDLDIGIYYFDKEPFAIENIRSIAKKYAGNDDPVVTGFYEWGPWVNGGAWINTSVGKVDILYKNIDQITSTIEKARNGIWENHFEQQPPYGFSSIIFLAESKSCIPLYDPDKIIEKLKSEVMNYPEKLKQAVIQQSLWSAEFTIWHAEHFAKKQDVYNIMGCLARAVKNIMTALFAINELYPIGDKRAIESIESSTIKPAQLKQKIENILCAEKNTIHNNIALLKVLWNETVNLSPWTYKPFYNL
ncbi:MAG TPA: nucleotidyltransferase domain-containing protein [Chitinophagaceae bacterium]|nr:nucleotidyltransferase domain-containing protein [Chitinophagaceae bacterium]